MFIWLTWLSLFKKKTLTLSFFLIMFIVHSSLFRIRHLHLLCTAHGRCTFAIIIVVKTDTQLLSSNTVSSIPSVLPREWHIDSQITKNVVKDFMKNKWIIQKCTIQNLHDIPNYKLTMTVMALIEKKQWKASFTSKIIHTFKSDYS